MFKDLSISKKLYGGFGIVIIFTILIALFGVNRVDKINDTLNEVVEINSVKQRYAVNFRGSVHDRAIAIRDVVLSNGSSDNLFKSSILDIKKLEEFYDKSRKPLDDILKTNLLYQMKR